MRSLISFFKNLKNRISLVYCNKDKDFIFDVWPLTSFKLPPSPLPHNWAKLWESCLFPLLVLVGSSNHACASQDRGHLLLPHLLTISKTRVILPQWCFWFHFRPNLSPSPWGSLNVYCVNNKLSFIPIGIYVSFIPTFTKILGVGVRAWRLGDCPTSSTRYPNKTCDLCSQHSRWFPIAFLRTEMPNYLGFLLF